MKRFGIDPRFSLVERHGSIAISDPHSQLLDRHCAPVGVKERGGFDRRLKTRVANSAKADARRALTAQSRADLGKRQVTWTPINLGIQGLGLEVKEHVASKARELVQTRA